MGGSVIHELVTTSYASMALNAPTSSVVVTSPPATKILRPSVPQAPPLRGVGIRSFGALQELETGLYSSTTSVLVADRMKPWPVRPPMTYILPLTAAPKA